MLFTVPVPKFNYIHACPGACGVNIPHGFKREFGIVHQPAIADRAVADFDLWSEHEMVPFN
jgi:hypothetical protein